jgi:hypothetical protein
MMRKYMENNWGFWLGMAILVLMVLGLWGCSPRKTDPIRSGWSRSIAVGEATSPYTHQSPAHTTPLLYNRRPVSFLLSA